MSTQNFLERAATFGHSADALKAGHALTSEISVSSIDELKNLLNDGSTPDEQAARSESFLASAKASDADPDQALLNRINAHVFGNAPLSKDDATILKQAFPMKVTAVSAENISYPAGETKLGVSQLIVTYNYGTVTMADQAFLTCYNSTLSYTMDTLVRNGKPPANRGDFNILGITGGTGTVGNTGPNGGDGSNGSGGNCSSAGIAGAPGGPGNNGDAGKVGGVGNTGGNGLPSMPATIRINKEIKNTTSIIIYSCSGPGGVGGVGGTGGNGGKGGNGGNGATCGCTGSACGNGANGGAGGTGGQGGQGGNGVDGNGKINVYVPKNFSSYIQKVSGDAAPGTGGGGGAGGNGGGMGYRGSNGKHNDGGSNGNNGGPGNKGANGGNGTQTGKPSEIVVQLI